MDKPTGDAGAVRARVIARLLREYTGHGTYRAEPCRPSFAEGGVADVVVQRQDRYVRSLVVRTGVDAANPGEGERWRRAAEHAAATGARAWFVVPAEQMPAARALLRQAHVEADLCGYALDGDQVRLLWR
ncbi:hypothetical protein HY631_04410 [Candidatus Uhrbacteria bacterium]|nr:hypothetical protein [Candidatus Uhrbacteria bacterium]